MLDGNNRRETECMPSIPQFLVTLFTHLDVERVRYCVLRGYKGLPDVIDHDLDVLVAPGGADQYERVLLSVADSLGWCLAKKRRRFSFRQYVMVQPDGPGNLLLQVDSWEQPVWRGIGYVSTNAVLRSRLRYNDFWVASPGCEAAVSLLKEYLQYGQVKDLGNGRHKRRFAELAKEAPDNFLAAVEPCLGKETSVFLLDCVRTEDWETLEKNVRCTRWVLMGRALCKRPTGQLLDWLRFLWGHISDRLFRPSGFSVCIIGPDGSGKTTIIQGLRKRAWNSLFSGVLYYHGHMSILPPLKVYYNYFARLFGKPEKKTRSLCNGASVGDDPPDKLAKSISYLCYYTIDYVLGHIPIRRAKGAGKLVLFDRYVYDYFIQRVHMNIPRCLLKVITAFFHKPDLVIWLTNQPEVIHRRKPELTISQINEQLEQCRRLIESMPSRGVKVETIGDPETTLESVYGTIVTAMGNRYKQPGREAL